MMGMHLHSCQQPPAVSRAQTPAMQRVRVMAFFASSTAVVARTEATRRAARDQPDPLPAMLLGRLAVDHGHQGKGWPRRC